MLCRNRNRQIAEWGKNHECYSVDFSDNLGGESLMNYPSLIQFSAADASDNDCVFLFSHDIMLLRRMKPFSARVRSETAFSYTDREYNCA